MSTRFRVGYLTSSNCEGAHSKDRDLRGYEQSRCNSVKWGRLERRPGMR